MPISSLPQSSHEPHKLFANLRAIHNCLSRNRSRSRAEGTPSVDHSTHQPRTFEHDGKSPIISKRRDSGMMVSRSSSISPVDNEHEIESRTVSNDYCDEPDNFTSTHSDNDTNVASSPKFDTNYSIDFSMGSDTPRHIKLLGNAYDMYCEFHADAEKHFFISAQEMVTRLLNLYRLLNNLDLNSQAYDDTLSQAQDECDGQIRSLTEHLILAAQKHTAANLNSTYLPRSLEIPVSRTRSNSNASSIGRPMPHYSYKSKSNRHSVHGSMLGSSFESNQGSSYPTRSHGFSPFTSNLPTSISRSPREYSRSYQPRPSSYHSNRLSQQYQYSPVYETSSFRQRTPDTLTNDFPVAPPSEVSPAPAPVSYRPVSIARLSTAPESEVSSPKPLSIPRASMPSAIPRLIPKSRMSTSPASDTKSRNYRAKALSYIESGSLSSRPASSQSGIPSPRPRFEACAKQASVGPMGIPRSSRFTNRS